MPSTKYSAEDSQLTSDLFELSKKSPKLCRSTAYSAPAEPMTFVRSWKLTEHKYYDIPSPFPTLARGLFTTELEPHFVDDEGKSVKYRIVARGYDKFFNIGEVPWTTWEALEAHTTPPYTLSLKSNGCIIFIAALTPDKLIVTSKHSLGPIDGVALSHAQAGEIWLQRYLEAKGKTKADFARRLWNENWTAVAELCDDSFEEHVLPYPPERTGLHLHGLNVATKAFITMPHQVVDSFAEEWGFIKTRTLTVSSIAEVKEFTDRISKEGEWEGEAVEGFVVRTHVTEPPTEGRGSPKRVSEIEKGRSPYAPGSSFFFKVKFDEPYMMYRDWREVTKKLLSTKGGMNASNLPRGKVKRKETHAYVKWVLAEIKKDRKAFDGYTKGHGIIATRERFLKWYEEQQEDAKGSGRSGEESTKKVTESEEETEEGEVAGAGKEREPKAREHKKGKDKKEVEVTRERVIIMPVAIPGSGKTSVAITLSHLFGFGHFQSDDVKARKAAPIFLGRIKGLLERNGVAIADKNNHLKQHRAQLREIANKFTPPARLIALNWSLSDLPPASIQKICSDRIVSRGENHQSLIPQSPKGVPHDDVLWMFINTYEEFSSSEADAVIDMNIEDDLESMVSCAVDGLFNTKLLTGPGGVLEGVEKPDEKRIEKAIKDTVGRYKVKRIPSRERLDAREAEMEIKKGKPPRYFGLLPELDLGTVLDGIFDNVSPNEVGASAKAKEFWEYLKEGKRVTEQPHITIAHKKQLPENQDVWDNCMLATMIPDEHALTFECTIGRILWDAGNVMVLVVDELHLGSFLTVNAEAHGIGEGTELLKAMSEETRNRLHVTVGTANTGIMPVEGKTLIERWRAGDREEQGVYEFELSEKIVVGGKLARLWS